MGRSTAAGGAQSVVNKYDWRAPNRLLVVQIGLTVPVRPRSSKRMRYGKVDVTT